MRFYDRPITVVSAHAIYRLPTSPGVYIPRHWTELPLYVGQSVNVRARLRQHSRRAPWWPDVCDVAVLHVAREDLDAVELWLIRWLEPENNLAGLEHLRRSA